MVFRILSVLVLVSLVPLLAWAEEKPEAVPDLIQVIELDAPLADVWKAFTTNEEAAKWMAPVVEIDLRSGGTMKTNYSKEAGIGGPGTIVHHILALDAPHLLVAKTEAPEGNPFKNVLQHLTGSWRFEALSPTKTRVTLGMHGWPAGTESKGVRAFFERANPGVLKKLQTLFPPQVPGKDAMARMRTIVGSWDATLELGGRTLIIRKEIHPGPGGKGLVVTTAFGPEGERRLHKHEQVWLESDGADCRFRALDDKGGSVAGSLRCDGDADVLWDFEDRGRAMRLRMSTGAGDGHRFAVQTRGKDGTYAEMFHVDYKRAPKK